MKFLLDMGISPSVTKFLHSLGHDAVHLLDLQMARADDHAIVELA
jgi:predicted nuclease of predicted toxin-antitoxin system